MVTHHLVFITHHFLLSFHHSSLKTPHPVWHHHSLVITQYFSIICCPIPVPCVAFTLLFLFPSTPSTHRTQWEKNNSKNKNQTHRTQKKKKKEELKTEQWKKKRKKKEEEDRIQRRKEKKKVKCQKLRLWVPLYMFNYKNVIELWVMSYGN